MSWLQILGACMFATPFIAMGVYLAWRDGLFELLIVVIPVLLVTGVICVGAGLMTGDIR